MAKYDSTKDTTDHIERVRELLGKAIENLDKRAAVHDASKLINPEKETFDEYTPKLRDSEYGSDEYKGFLTAMKPALEHHYENNSHHPEHYANGVSGMSLFDVLEMVCDWKAATERHATGDIIRSLEINKKRFEISEQLAEIIANTIKEFGWEK